MGLEGYMRNPDGKGAYCAIFLHEARQAREIGAEPDADTQQIRLIDLFRESRFYAALK